jgi:hypothetical protein
VSSGFGMTFIGILASQFNPAKGAFKGTANGKFAVSRYFLFLEKDCHLLWSEHGRHLALSVNKIYNFLKAKLVCE